MNIKGQLVVGADDGHEETFPPLHYCSYLCTANKAIRHG
jgi:hypothetical protein